MKKKANTKECRKRLKREQRTNEAKIKQTKNHQEKNNKLKSNITLNVNGLNNPIISENG